LIEEARAADANNEKEYGEQYAAYGILEKEFKEASQPYKVSLGVARIAFRGDREARKALVLGGKRKRTIAYWVRDTEVFYRNLLDSDAFKAGMAKFGRTEKILKAEYKEVKDVIDALAVHRKEMGEAQESTAIRDKVMEALDDWMMDFMGIARIALADQPDAFDKLGMK
jgi:hypothetical protein